MSFDVMPQDLQSRRKEQLAHAQNMLNLIAQLGSFNQQPLPKFNYGGKTQQLNLDAGNDFAATLLMASGGGNNARTSAMQRRLQRP